MVAATLEAVNTPLNKQAWAQALATHPDRAFRTYIGRGLKEGFRIGFRRGAQLRSASTNMHSAREHPEVIDKYLQEELVRGRMLGPFSSSDNLPSLHINRFGVIPKGRNTGKWRLITDLSFPQGASVNDAIDPLLCSLTYVSVDDIADLVVKLGPDTLMAKVDIESAYRLIPVHPEDRPLQAMEWQGKYFIDPMLPFGLRSAPKIFSTIADALGWVLRQRGVHNCHHYLDDYIILGRAHSAECSQALETLTQTCRELGVPLASHKQVGPTTCLVFLGIEVDSSTSELRLPADKLERLQATVVEWLNRKACARRDLESLIGLLNHACKVVRSGRAFSGG